MIQEAGHIKNIYYTYSCVDFPAHSMFTFSIFSEVASIQTTFQTIFPFLTTMIQVSRCHI